MLNSLKYCLLILALLSSHFMPAMRTGSELNVPSLIALVSQMYSLYWDLFQDFSLPKTLTHYRARKRSGVGATWWIAIVGVDVLVRGFRMLLSTRSPHEFVVMAAKKSVPPSASCLLEEAIRRLWWVVGRVSAENVALQEGATLHSSSDEDLSQKNTTYEDGLATINGNGSRTVEIMSHSPELSLSGREYSATVCSKQNQT
ncbi:hypothetical protein BC832DRAFT_227393 [Gaertneriomyces semiglobifer]|nr:hypothetical protein BC832DRAFT_227393 [Gaertneriomyces semiglobifer]